MILRSLSRFEDFGLLFLRAALGMMMIFHGCPKLAGGPATWEKVGAAVQYLGVSFYPVAWGLLAALAETLGGALLVLGFCFRPAALALFCTMVVATVMKYHVSGGEFLDWAWPAEMAAVFFSMIFLGPGKYGFDRG